MNVPHVPPIPSYPSRRQPDYHYSTPAHLPQPHHAPYGSYHHPPQYHGPPPMQHYPQQWYQSYQHYAPPAALRAYQQQSPLVVSSHPHAQPVVPVSRLLPQSSQPARPPPPEQSISSNTSQTQTIASPSPTPTSPSISITTPPVQASKPQIATPLVNQLPLLTQRMPFYPPLPWLSVPGSTFPPKAIRKRRKRQILHIDSDLVQLPSRQQPQSAASDEPESRDSTVTVSAGPDATDVETPETTLPPSEVDSTNPTTPSSIVPQPTTAMVTPIPSHKRTATIPIVPVIPIKPIVPALHNGPPPQFKSTTNNPVEETKPTPTTSSEGVDVSMTSPLTETTPMPSPLLAKSAPKSWAELLRSRGSIVSAPGAAALPVSPPVINGAAPNNANTLADALRLYTVENDVKLYFLEPRGLVNTGNMCYMNSILQILVFCVPFYEFLDQVGKRAVHNFKSDTPLVEAMIMFMREFPVIDSAMSVEQLRMRLKDNELEQYGEAFIPEYVYDIIKRLPRFSSMRRGHQQDAEEFLGFLLEGLHDECVHVMKKLIAEAPASIHLDIPTYPTSVNSGLGYGSGEGGWLEVGPKQKAAVTRSSGAIVTESPITKIFGGKLRSEFRVPGLQNSVTLEPYQPLQLDIGDPNIHNITDALKGLTRSETLHGEFKSPRGPNTTATKQVFIETLPPVLILHLKRFQYDNTGGTQKIWKKIGYPLELEIPKEVFPAHKRGGYTARPGGLPKYRLIGVVYHHGKNASGGHYTVDVRRQEGCEWIRLDDTIIRRVRSEDVASEGGEEEPKLLAKALEQHTRDQDAGRNIYKAAGFDDGDEGEDDDNHGGWSQVNGHATSPTTGVASKKWTGVINGDGTATPSTAGKQTPREGPKYSVKDNKVAYILFYQQINP